MSSGRVKLELADIVENVCPPPRKPVNVTVAAPALVTLTAEFVKPSSRRETPSNWLDEVSTC